MNTYFLVYYPAGSLVVIFIQVLSDTGIPLMIFDIAYSKWTFYFYLTQFSRE